MGSRPDPAVPAFAAAVAQAIDECAVLIKVRCVDVRVFVKARVRMTRRKANGSNAPLAGTGVAEPCTHSQRKQKQDDLHSTEDGDA